jgi:hypothetical protein
MVDAVPLIASIDRPIRFLVFKGSYDRSLVKPFAKIMGVQLPGLMARDEFHKTAGFTRSG